MQLRAKQFRWDQVDRVVWTLVQAAIGYGLTDLVNIPPQYGALFAAGIALLKTQAAKHVGLKDTGALLPAAKDPASPPPNPPAGG